MTHTDPGLAFWLSWAEHRGALAEDTGGGTAVVVLPEGVQRALDLPEQLAVTADPDAAREEGALLLVPGQPVLDQAAELVLAEGDSGAAWAPWPEGAAPRTATLVEAARHRFPVDHGRIDPAGEPAAVYAPLLRVGALLTYTLSLDLRFQEREEVWVDARTGMEVPARLRRRLGAVTGPRPRGGRPELPADIGPALGAAHALLGDRARERLCDLSCHAADDRRRQMASAEAYYRDAMASVDRRRATATAERAAVLDGQRVAIDVERSRRLAEIEATFTARHELRPFRAHLVFVPALQVPVDVRRGSRVYPFTLTWHLGAATFAGFGCPHCGGQEPLVAGRRHLGCRECLPPPPLATPARPAPVAPVAPVDHENLPEAPAQPAPCPPAPAAETAAAPPRRPGAGASPRHGRPGGRAQPSRRAVMPSGGAEAVGRRLAEELWAGPFRRALAPQGQGGGRRLAPRRGRPPVRACRPGLRRGAGLWEVDR